LKNAKKQKKEKHRGEGTTRGTEAAGLDAADAALGSMGLLAFAFVVWRFVTKHIPCLALATATLVWLTVSVLVWEIRKAA
jgi:hypothetical protein